MCIWICIDFKWLLKFSENDYLFRPVVCPSVSSSAWNNKQPTVHTFWKLLLGFIFQKSVENIQF